MRPINFCNVLIIFSVLSLILFTTVCQGHSHSYDFLKKFESNSSQVSVGEPAFPGVGARGALRTFSDYEDGDEPWWRRIGEDPNGNLEYGLTSLVIWPVLLLIFGILAVPTTLVIVVAFVIPLLAPDGAGEGRSGRLLPLTTSSFNNKNIWMPVYLAQEVLKGSESECIERISCEMTRAARQSGNPLASWLQKQLRNSAVLGYNLQTRLARAVESAEKESSTCFQFKCLPLGTSDEDGFSSRSWDFSGFYDKESIWDWFVHYWGGRYIYVRKLAANKDVDFFPHRP